MLSGPKFSPLSKTLIFRFPKSYHLSKHLSRQCGYSCNLTNYSVRSRKMNIWIRFHMHQTFDDIVFTVIFHGSRDWFSVCFFVFTLDLICHRFIHHYTKEEFARIAHSFNSLIHLLRTIIRPVEQFQL
jgi:hypothetical protein